MLASKRLYVAGSPEPGELPGAKVKDNFRGCMRKVSFSSYIVYLPNDSTIKTAVKFLETTYQALTIVIKKPQNTESPKNPVTYGGKCKLLF